MPIVTRREGLGHRKEGFVVAAGPRRACLDNVPDRPSSLARPMSLLLLASEPDAPVDPTCLGRVSENWEGLGAEWGSRGGQRLPMSLSEPPCKVRHYLAIVSTMRGCASTPLVSGPSLCQLVWGSIFVSEYGSPSVPNPFSPPENTQPATHCCRSRYWLPETQATRLRPRLPVTTTPSRIFASTVEKSLQTETVLASLPLPLSGCRTRMMPKSTRHACSAREHNNPDRQYVKRCSVKLAVIFSFFARLQLLPACYDERAAGHHPRRTRPWLLRIER